MKIVEGSLHNGSGDFTKRMTRFPGVFKHATGEELFPGTLNVQVKEEIEIKEHFRIRGSEIQEPDQDLLWKYAVSTTSGHTGYDHSISKMVVAGTAIISLRLLATLNFGSTLASTNRLSRSPFSAKQNRSDLTSTAIEE